MGVHMTMVGAALKTWAHLGYPCLSSFYADCLISEALSHEALSLNVISHATFLLLWVTSVLLRVVLYPLQAAVGQRGGRGVVGLWVECRAAGARLSPDVCALVTVQ